MDRDVDQGFVKVGATVRELQGSIEAAGGGCGGSGTPMAVTLHYRGVQGDGGMRGADVAEVRARPGACG